MQDLCFDPASGPGLYRTVIELTGIINRKLERTPLVEFPFLFSKALNSFVISSVVSSLISTGSEDLEFFSIRDLAGRAR